MTQLALLGLGQYPSFLRPSPKGAVVPRCQEVILREQYPLSQEVGWVVFGSLVGDGCLLSFRGIGYKLLLVMVREETKEVKFRDLFLSPHYPSFPPV